MSSRKTLKRKPRGCSRWQKEKLGTERLKKEWRINWAQVQQLSLSSHEGEKPLRQFQGVHRGLIEERIRHLLSIRTSQ
eukprot:c19870_g2_i2 orf=460-693(-)